MKASQLLLRIVALVIAGVGIWLLLQSTALGEQSATAILARNQGGMDTAKYLTLVEGSISAYRWLGAVLVALGLYRASEGVYRIL